MSAELTPEAPDRRWSPRKRLAAVAVLLLAVILLSLFLGRYPSIGLTSPKTLMHDELGRRLVLTLRLPRVLTAVVMGMCLAAAGAVFQQVFANPLVEPALLGVTQGSSFGAALAIILVGPVGWLIQVLAATFAFVALTMSYLVATRGRFGSATLRLILAGIAVSTLFFGLTGLMQYLADPLTQLPEITLWLLGGLTGITWAQLGTIAPVVLICLVVIHRMRWRLNLLSLDDAAAHSLGVSTGRERALVLVTAVAATAAVVSVCGEVRWLGLIVPHIARRIFGADARYAVPASLLIGGLVGVICDDVSRTLIAAEIPIGIITAVFGAAFFIAILTGFGRTAGER